MIALNSIGTLKKKKEEYNPQAQDKYATFQEFEYSGR